MSTALPAALRRDLVPGDWITDPQKSHNLMSAVDYFLRKGERVGIVREGDVWAIEHGPAGPNHREVVSVRCEQCSSRPLRDRGHSGLDPSHRGPALLATARWHDNDHTSVVITTYAHHERRDGALPVIHQSLPYVYTRAQLEKESGIEEGRAGFDLGVRCGRCKCYLVIETTSLVEALTTGKTTILA